MKKDLTQYYVEVTEKDAKKVAKIINNPFVSEKSIKSSIDRGYNILILWQGEKDFVLSKKAVGSKISLKTLTNYIAYNNQVDRSFVEPKEIKTLTQELAVKQQALEAINEKNNETLDQLEAEKKKTDKLEIAVCMLGFALLVVCVILSQKM